MKRHTVCKMNELPVGERKVITLDGRSIGIFNVRGTYYALRNSCPHQGASLCKGKVTGTMLPSAPGTYEYGREGEIVQCPWHRWEFDITTGKSIFNPHRCLVKTYEVKVESELPEEEQTEAQLETYPVVIESGWVVVYV